MQRSYEKFLFAAALGASIAVLAVELVPDDRPRAVLGREALATRAIEAAVRGAREASSGEVRPIIDLASRAQLAYQAPHPTPEWGSLAGLAFYPPPPIEIVEPKPPTAPVEPVRAPSGLTVLVAEPDAVEIAWEAVTRAREYRVVRRTLESAPGSPVPADVEFSGLAAPQCLDRSVVGPARFAYTVTALAADDGTGAAATLEVEVPDRHRVRFVEYNEVMEIARFVVQIYKDGIWYGRTFYQIRPGDRVGRVLTPAGFPRHVECAPVEGSGNSLWLDLTTPFVFEGVQSEEIRVLATVREFLVRYGPGPADLEWAADLEEFRARHPDLATPAEFARDERGNRIWREIERPVATGRPGTRYRAVLRDVRLSADADPILRDAVEE